MSRVNRVGQFAVRRTLLILLLVFIYSFLTYDFHISFGASVALYRSRLPTIESHEHTRALAGTSNDVIVSPAARRDATDGWTDPAAFPRLHVGLTDTD